LQAAARTTPTAASLAAALATFQSAIAAVAARLSAALPTPVAAPTLRVAGVNA
jgi:hypothetical protein